MIFIPFILSILSKKWEFLYIQADSRPLTSIYDPRATNPGCGLPHFPFSYFLNQVFANRPLLPAQDLFAFTDSIRFA